MSTDSDLTVEFLGGFYASLTWPAFNLPSSGEQRRKKLFFLLPSVLKREAAVIMSFITDAFYWILINGPVFLPNICLLSFFETRLFFLHSDNNSIGWKRLYFLGSKFYWELFRISVKNTWRRNIDPDMTKAKESNWFFFFYIKVTAKATATVQLLEPHVWQLIR